MSKISQKQSKNPPLLIGAWLLSLATLTASVVAWGTSYNYHFLPIQPYQLFPLLGLIAFGLMWAHYMVGTLIDVTGAQGITFKSYFRYTSYVVLACLLLHPGLLAYQRYRDGFGLPPSSTASYVAPGLGWVVMLGTISLVIFLAYEFHRIYEKRSWWHYVSDAGDFAMLAILYHGFKLGGQLQMDGWFRLVWLLYATTFIMILFRKYYLRVTKKSA